MHESTAQRIQEIPTADRPANLPDDSHIISGRLVGHGSTSFASEKAKISGKVVKLERTSDGGIDYQFAIFVSEPAPPKLEVVPPAEDPQLLAAVEYFVSKGLSDGDARKKVAQFGVSRVLAAREKELDDQLAQTLSQTAAPKAK
jgi:hypothetical protein